ncbi:uncharacterized protein BT62DRAFT_1041928 [Guyanagaster necrorhizus]|uniref:Serine hydrolase domain-containing protein n=1 Tax=Guyanagaster necrorhizus TaxID=856835 RepID=A0A9P8ANM6_9AGAR|nr:uncharacterized protein BT62DRAFT_1041928 [Guyanagaster necrorhizus MCA 3950]KAG7442009.1 hypothetical protein BT62DRAFT_1041928 [Guyanagaster necrorhizus MCA 3950]
MASLEGGMMCIVTSLELPDWKNLSRCSEMFPSRGHLMYIWVQVSINMLMARVKLECIAVVGQGAAMAAFLSALLENPQSYPLILVDGKPPHPPFQFSVCIAGYRIRPVSRSRV